MKIKVSIIVPVWNVEKYLEQCLDSLVNQTLKEIEIIIVNDGSPDNSQAIIDSYVKKYPKLVRSFIKENGGQGSARNFGLSKAKGNYISFVDSDDWLDLNALEEMYNVAIANDSDVVICDMIDHLKNNEIYHDCTNYRAVYEVTPSACNKIFKKDIIEDIKFLPNLWYEDFNFTTKILLKTQKISQINKGFYHCNCREVSTMNNNNSIKNLDMIKVIEDLKIFAKENNLYNEEIFTYLIYNHILITSINRVAIQKNRNKNKVIKKFIRYCRETIPNYRKMNFYINERRNKKIIAWLNYHYFYYLSKLILRINSLLKRGGK